jgi:predicted secreted protein
MCRPLFLIVLCVLAAGRSSLLHADSQENVTVAVGEQFTVALASNPSTGYSWSLAGSLPNWLQQVDKTYIADNPGVIGGGGTEYWTFRATGPGSTTLTFQYMQPWVGTPIEEHIVLVTAQTPADTEKIDVVVGEEFKISLKSNPSTGYSWSLAASLPNWLLQVDKTYVADNLAMIGGSGTEIWTFQATAAGSTTLTFQYERPWEGTPIQTHSWQVAATALRNTQSIFVAADEDFTVALASNPSTGYSWALAQPLPSWLVQVDKTYVTTNPAVIGGGGTEYWTFRATAAGSTTLVFQYERPSEGAPIQVRVCRVTATSPTDAENLFVVTGEDFTVALASNPSTGYSWTLAQSPPSWLVQVDKTYVATNPGVIGSGGTEHWTFRATVAGSATLVFQYERPWEGTPTKVHLCKVTASMQEPNLVGFETGDFSVLAWRQRNTP